MLRQGAQDTPETRPAGEEDGGASSLKAGRRGREAEEAGEGGAARELANPAEYKGSGGSEYANAEGGRPWQTQGTVAGAADQAVD